MRSASALLLLTLLAARSGAAETDVRVSGDKVDVRATAATVSDVLDRLGRQTGMKVVYDGAPPRARINVDRTGLTPVEAVLAVLEGQGLNYAMRMDRTGTRIEQLLLVASAGAAPAPAPPARPEVPRLFQRDREPEPPEPDEEAPPAEAPGTDEETGKPRFLPGVPVPTGPAMPLTLPTPPPVPPSPNPGAPANPQESGPETLRNRLQDR